MSINTVIFDLDGTLLYTLEDLTNSTNNALSFFGYQLKTIDEIKNAVGNGVGLLIERVIPDGSLNPNYEKCLQIFKNDYSKNMYNFSKPYDEIIELLTKLKEQDYKTAVVSNKFDSAVKNLCPYYFNNLIDCAIGQNDEIPPKPSPKSLYEVMKILNVTKEQCIYVGDSEVDIQTAINAEIPCLSVTWGYKSIDFLYQNGAETLVYSPLEILDLI